MTYLSDCGAPTLILDCRNSQRPSETAQVYGSMKGGTLCWPQRWKHLAFDGQLLHGTVPMPTALSGRRITFLVNLWLNHRPSNCRRLPKGLRRGSTAAVSFRELKQTAARVADLQLTVGFGRRRQGPC